eukprot:15364968-Ditylum_brightwellii.AAC.1
MDVLTVTMNNYFACDTLQRLKPRTQFDVDAVRYITFLKHWNKRDAKHHVYFFDNSKVKDETKELNYDTLQQSVDKTSINNYTWINRSKLDDTVIAVRFLPPSFILSDVINYGQMC